MPSFSTRGASASNANPSTAPRRDFSYQNQTAETVERMAKIVKSKMQN